MDPIPRTQAKQCLAGRTVSQILYSEGDVDTRWEVGGRGKRGGGSKIREDMFTGSLHVQRPLWMKESFFLSEEGGASTAGWKR